VLVHWLSWEWNSLISWDWNSRPYVHKCISYDSCQNDILEFLSSWDCLNSLMQSMFLILFISWVLEACVQLSSFEIRFILRDATSSLIFESFRFDSLRTQLTWFGSGRNISFLVTNQGFLAFASWKLLDSVLEVVSQSSLTAFIFDSSSSSCEILGFLSKED
jgi:hypothetical protein